MRLLLKDKPYVALAYMTGILPINKHSSGLALKIFFRIKEKLEYENGNKNIINYIEKVYKNNK